MSSYLRDTTLVSPNFLASDFILKEELPRLVAAVDDGLTILWIPLFGAFENQELKARLKPISTYQAVIDPKIPLDQLEPNDQISALVKVCRKISAMLFPEKGIIQNLPFPSLCSLFKGREKELEKLDEHLRKQGAAAITQPKAISGLGGIGKTRLAVEYAWRRHDEFNAFLFVKADTPGSLNANLAALAGLDILDLPEQKLENEEERKQAVLRWLRQHRGWLLILDNVDTRESAKAVEVLIPKIPGGQVIITSRLTEWSGAVHCSSLDVISLSDATAFIVDRTKDRRPLLNDQTLAEKLAQHLGCLPLALEQAAAYINRRRRPLDEYLKELMGNTARVLEWYDVRIMSYPSSIATTWLTTLNCLGVTEKALLRAISFFATDPIPVVMFKSNTNKIAELVKLWCEETKEEQKQSEPEEAIAELAAFSLVTWSGDSFTIHRMLQEVVKSRTPGERLPLWVEQVTQLICDFAPKETAENPSTWSVWDILRSHAEKLVEYSNADSRIHANLALNNSLAALYFGKGLYVSSLDLEQKALEITEARFNPDSSEMADRYLCCGESFRMLGHSAEAEQMFRKSLAIRERVDGPKSERCTTCLNYIALALNDQGKKREAEALWRECFKIYESYPNYDKHDFAKCLNNLAGIVINLDEQESLYRKSLEICEQVLGKDHTHTLIVIVGLGYLLTQKGKIDEGESMLNQAICGFERIQHPFLATALCRKADIFRKNGQYDDAEPLLRKALIITEKMLGEDHPDTIKRLDYLGVLLNDKGDYNDAELLYRRALDIREKVLGKEHTDTATNLNNLAGLLQDKGDYDGAEPLYRRALDIREKVLGNEHQDTATSLNNLAGLLEKKGGYAEAESLYHEALVIREKLLGSEHQDVAETFYGLAELFYSKGEYKKSAPLSYKALTIREKVLSKESLYTAQSLDLHARLLAKNGEYESAELSFRRAISIRESVLGSEHLYTAQSQNNLGCLLVSKGNYEGAEPLYRKALAIYEKKVGSKHPDTIKILCGLANMLYSKGDYDGTVPLYRRALVIREKALGNEHSDTITARYNLAQLLRYKGDHKGAMPLYRQLIEIHEELSKKNISILPHISEMIAISNNNLAFDSLVPEKNWKDAEHHYQKAIDLFNKVPNPVQAANSELNLQTLYHLSGQQVDVERVKTLTQILEKAKDKRAEKGHKILKEISE